MRALFNVVLLYISFVFLVKHISALSARVPGLSTPEAKYKAALAFRFGPHFTSFHKMAAVWSRTPPQILVNIYYVVLSKTKVFSIEISRYETLDNSLRE